MPATRCEEASAEGGSLDKPRRGFSVPVIVFSRMDYMSLMRSVGIQYNRRPLDVRVSQGPPLEGPFALESCPAARMNPFELGGPEDPEAVVGDTHQRSLFLPFVHIGNSASSNVPLDG